MAADSNVETIGSALKVTQELRSSVSQVFEELSNGMKDVKNEKGKEKSFLTDLGQRLQALNKDFWYER